MVNCLWCDAQINEALTITNFYARPVLICEACDDALQQCKIQTKACCTTCLKPISDNQSQCMDCAMLAKRYQRINQLYCNFQYKGMMKAVLQQYKFNRDYVLCTLIARYIQLPRMHYDYIIPIPSHSSRDRWRTFNPVTAVLACMHVKYTNCLTMQYDRKQSSLTKRQRLSQPNPFIITADLDFTNKNILLVDDIYTTGITVHQAACKFFVRKIRKLDVFTFAR